MPVPRLAFARLLPQPRPHIKTTSPHDHYLFFVPFSFCKKQSQKPVQNHQCGCPVLYYKNSFLIDNIKGEGLTGNKHDKLALLSPARNIYRFQNRFSTKDPLGRARRGFWREGVARASEGFGGGVLSGPLRHEEDRGDTGSWGEAKNSPRDSRKVALVQGGVTKCKVFPGRVGGIGREKSQWRLTLLPSTPSPSSPKLPLAPVVGGCGWGLGEAPARLGLGFAFRRPLWQACK